MTTTTWVTSRLQHYFDDYAEAHRTKGNKLCHSVGIPSITMTLLGLLGSLEIAGGLTQSEMIRLDGGTLLLGFAILWYLYLDWKIAIPFGLFGYGLYLIGRSIPTPWLWGIFVAGWVFQYIGHIVYEKKSPAFYRNIMHIFVGPLWIFSRWVGYLPR